MQSWSPSHPGISTFPEEWSMRCPTANSFPHRGLQFILHMSHTDSGGRTQVCLTAHIPMASWRLWHTANKIPRFSTTEPIALFATKTLGHRLSWLTVTARACVCGGVRVCLSLICTWSFVFITVWYICLYVFQWLYLNSRFQYCNIYRCHAHAGSWLLMLIIRSLCYVLDTAAVLPHFRPCST
jgi:hypothetical protein